MDLNHLLFEFDPRSMLMPDVAVLEMFLRGTLIYLGIFVILRIFRRPTGQLSVADVLLITIIADAAQNAMAGGYESVGSGLVLIGTIVFWDRLIDDLAHRYPAFARIAEPPPVALVREGKTDQAALDKHKISDQDLQSHLRQHGIESAADARLCVLESDGKISVIRRGGDC